MEFKKERCYSALNADELRAGDKVITANDLNSLKEYVARADEYTTVIRKILEDWSERRFMDDDDCYSLAYLVERAENCTNCKFKNSMQFCRIKLSVNYRCKDYEPVETKTTKKHLRPFKDCDELIKVWGEKDKQGLRNEALDMPLIWVRNKVQRDSVELIVGFDNEGVEIARQYAGWITLFNCFEFFDGTPCGVEE